MNWPEVFFWVAMAVEAVILVCFAGFAFLHVIPWETMRQNREALRELRVLLPRLLPRAHEAVRMAANPQASLRVESVKETQARMSTDAGRLATLCLQLLQSLGRDLASWPVPALAIVRDVDATLDMVEQLCKMRDTKLPDIERRLIEAAEEQLVSAESLRHKVWVRASDLADQGAPLEYELLTLQRFGNVITSHRLLASRDPERLATLSHDWFARIRDVAESAELRAAVWRRVSEVRASFGSQVDRIRSLQQALRPFLADRKVGERLTALAFTDATVDRAEQELHKAESLLAEPATDVGVKNASGKRLVTGLRAVELCCALLESHEKDLDLLVAAVAAATASKGSN